MEKTFPYLITLLSGLFTIVGFFTIYIKKEKNIIIKNSLSFAAGIMICLSIVELIPEGLKSIKTNTYQTSIISILIGMIIPSLINKILKNDSLYKIGILSTISIIIHNIPEGIITYLTSLNNIKLGIIMGFSIAMHNIPEGISIAIPIYYSTKSKKKTFKIILLSALSELLGAILAQIYLKKYITNSIIGITLLIVAGIMSYISLIELLPKALKYKEKKKTIVFFIIGIIIMYISVIIIK